MAQADRDVGGTEPSEPVWFLRTVRIGVFAFLHAAVLVVCTLLARQTEPWIPGLPVAPGTLFCLPVTVLLSIPRFVLSALLEPLRESMPHVEITIWLVNSVCYGILLEMLRPHLHWPLFVRRTFGFGEFADAQPACCPHCGAPLSGPAAERCPACGQTASVNDPGAARDDSKGGIDGP